VYSVHVRIGNEEILHVASHNELEEAVDLVRKLKAHWPHEYVVRDPDGNEIDITE
jgi:hypothetical protein